MIWRHELFHASLGHTHYLDAALACGLLLNTRSRAGPRIEGVPVFHALRTPTAEQLQTYWLAS